MPLCFGDAFVDLIFLKTEIDKCIFKYTFFKYTFDKWFFKYTFFKILFIHMIS